MEDDPTTSPAPPPASEDERTKAEDESTQGAPADPADDAGSEGDSENGTDGTADASEPMPTADNELPRTTTTGDDEKDLRSAGDGAASGPPGDDLDDSTQRHD